MTRVGDVGGQEPPASCNPHGVFIAMLPVSPRRPTQSKASFHDASARESYGHHFRPIGIQAVAAGTRRAFRELHIRSEEHPDTRPGVLRNGFDD